MLFAIAVPYVIQKWGKDFFFKYFLRTRIICDFFFFSYKKAFLLTKVYCFMTTGLSWATLHFVVASC